MYTPAVLVAVIAILAIAFCVSTAFSFIFRGEAIHRRREAAIWRREANWYRREAVAFRR